MKKKKKNEIHLECDDAINTRLIKGAVKLIFNNLNSN